MGGKSGQEVPAELMSFTYGGLIAKQAKGDPPRDFSNQHVVVAAERNEKCPIVQPLLSQIHQERTSHNHFSFLPTSSTVIRAVPGRDIPKGLLVTVGSRETVKWIPEFQREILYNNSGKAINSDPTDSSCDMDASKTKPSIHMFNSNNLKASINPPWLLHSNQYDMPDGENCDIPMARPLSPRGEGESQNKFMSTENQICAQNHPSTTPESIEEGSNVLQLPTVTVAVPGFPSRQGATARSNMAGRLRRARIAEGFKALQEIMPHSEEDNKEAVLDDIIDYVKYLQLQIKALSQSRLGGEEPGDPLIQFEGFGHYWLHKQMLSEPLEEMIGRLMEVNMPAATYLLESKGLHVMPMALAEGLFQAN